MMTPVTTKAWGILGDSLTLLGSVVLAWETLHRRRAAGDRRATLATAFRLEEGKLVLVNKEGTPVNEVTIEDEEISFARGLALAGVLILVLGFSILLMVRIFGVESKKQDRELSMFVTNGKRHRYVHDPKVGLEVEANRQQFASGASMISLEEILRDQRQEIAVADRTEELRLENVLENRKYMTVN